MKTLTLEFMGLTNKNTSNNLEVSRIFGAPFESVVGGRFNRCDHIHSLSFFFSDLALESCIPNNLR